jgi:hypothetical protein
MATQLQLRRGTTSETGSFTGAVGEVTVDTTKDTLVVHDGSTAGGHEVAKNDGSNMTAIDVGDNVQLKMGNSDDLAIYHDGSRSYISDQGTGGLRLLTNELSVMSPDESENLFFSVQDGSTYLYQNGSPKLSTSSGGVDVTGSLSADGAILSGNLELNYAYPRIKLTDTDHNSDYSIINNNGEFGIFDDTNNAYRLNVSASGDVTISNGNLDVSGTNVNNGCRVQFTNAAASKVYQISAGQSGVSNNNFVIRNVTDSTFPLVIDDNSNVSIPHGNLTVGANLEVQGADVTVTANIKHAGDGDTFFGFNANDSWRVVTGGAEGIKVDSSQNVSIPNGDLTIASGNGVYLGGTAAANKLDDYEEGTWTPTFKDLSSNSASASTATGTYVKIGSVVHIQGTLIDINTSGLTGGDSALLGGFPFTINNASATRAHGLLQSNDVTFTEGTAYLQGNNGQVQAGFKFNKTGAGAQQIAVNAFTSGSADVFFSMSYQTTA